MTVSVKERAKKTKSWLALANFVYSLDFENFIEQRFYTFGFEGMRTIEVNAGRDVTMLGY